MSPKRRMPTKAELIQLQKLYRTDEKIGERLGGVPAYLVAYWRRKKNVPKHSQPKYSEAEIRNLWERYGDDDKCGLELGISKAAFYNWRRRYGIREKPAFLKLEQLELNFPGLKSRTHAPSLYGKRTMAQKIIARAVKTERVEVGQSTVAEPDMVVVQGSAGEVVRSFRQQKTEYVWNPSRIAVMLSSGFDDPTGRQADDNMMVRDFARRQRIRNLHDLQEGVCLQTILENGEILPGQLGFSTDHYAAAFGCISTLVMTIDSSAMGRLWADGTIQLTVPPSVRIDISGRRSRGVYARDILLSAFHKLGADGVRGKVIEFHGPVVSQMSISERLTLAGLSKEVGALGAICPYDSTTRRFLTGRTANSYAPTIPDKDAEYETGYQLNVDPIAPQIGCTGDAGNVKAAAELEGLAISQVILGTCLNGRFEDFRVAANVLKGKKVHNDCRLYVYPASRSVYLEALKKGLIRVLVEAGAIVMGPCCGDASNLIYGDLADGERCLSTAPIIPSGAGSAKADNVLLCSPATAAASALNAAVTDPTGYVK